MLTIFEMTRIPIVSNISHSSLYFISKKHPPRDAFSFPHPLSHDKKAPGMKPETL